MKLHNTTDSFDRLVGLLSSRFNAPEGTDHEPVIFVFGAGASLESGNPIWGDPDLRRDLIDAVEGGQQHAFVSEAWAQLARQLPTSRSEPHAQERKDMLVKHARTDHLCGVACTLVEWHHRLLAFLQTRYHPPRDTAGPQLAYELTAHLIKHRFVDHVVSLNFDEVLDKALEDELGSDGYELVLPGGTTPSSLRQLPYYFKLHGTISNVDSLRFATTNTGMVSPRIVDLLDKVIFHKRSRKNKAWIVSLGYSWTDPDLLQWLARHSANLAGVLCIGVDDRPAEAVRDGFEQSHRKRHGAVPEIFSISTKDLVETGPAATVDEVLWAVWRATRALAKEPDRVPSAARHFLVTHLFPHRSQVRRWPSIYTAHSSPARFEAEVFLTVGKTDGMVTLSSLARDGRIARHWSEELTKGARRRGSILDKVDFVSRSQDADMTEVYLYAGNSSKEYAAHFDRSRGKTLSFSKTLVPDLQGKRISVPRLVRGRIRRNKQKYSHFLSHYLRKVFDGPSVEVDPGQDLRTSFLFTAPEALPTHKALRDRTRDLIASQDWTTLLVIAESGHWLQDYQGNMLPDQSIFLIEASMFGVPDWRLRRPVQLDPDHALMIGIPWWVHNRHLTLAIGRDGKCSGGIYFRRRQRTPRISPIGLSEKSDLHQLVKIFLAYSTRFLEARGRWSGGIGLPQYPRADEFFDKLAALDVVSVLGAEAQRWQSRLHLARYPNP